MKVLELVIVCVVVLYLVWGLIGYLTGERHVHNETRSISQGGGRTLKFCGSCKEWYE